MDTSAMENGNKTNLTSMLPGREAYLKVRIETILSGDEVVVTLMAADENMKQILVSPGSLTFSMNG